MDPLFNSLISASYLGMYLTLISEVKPIPADLCPLMLVANKCWEAEISVGIYGFPLLEASVSLKSRKVLRLPNTTLRGVENRDTSQTLRKKMT